jgi:hypothetical protein
MTSVYPYDLSNIKNDYSNTPVSYDGLGYNIRNFPSHPRVGFVIFIDVLGIKGIWLQKDPDEVFSTWKNTIIQFISSTKQHLKEFSPYVTTVSDTIIICCDCSMNEISRIFDALLVPFRYSIHNEFPLRGSISYGTYYLSNILIIGGAIDDAASMHNKINMLGVFTTPGLSIALDKMRLVKNSESMCRYGNIVTKGGSYYGLALKWYNNQDKKIRNYLQNQLVLQQDDKVKEKYRNTVNYCKFIVSLDQKAGRNS